MFKVGDDVISLIADKWHDEYFEEYDLEPGVPCKITNAEEDVYTVMTKSGFTAYFYAYEIESMIVVDYVNMMEAICQILGLEKQ